MGGNSDTKRQEASNLDRGVHRFRQPRSYSERSPTGGAGVRGGGGRQPRRGDVRRGGPTAVEHTEGGGTTSVPRYTANVCPRASHGLRDATDCSPS